jgi:hypothetical protein
LAATGELGLCSLLQRDDVTRLTAWQVDSVRRKRYDFNGATVRCASSNRRSGPSSSSSPSAVCHSRATHRSPTRKTKASFGTAHRRLHRRDLAVRVVPNSHIASYFEVEPFAETIIRRVKN